MLKPEFSVRRTGQRYDRGQVDTLVERVIATAERRSTGPAVTVGELRSAEFRTPLFGPGYPVREVDDFLAQAEDWLPDRPVSRSTPGSVERTAPMFTPVRLREGYATEEVDEFLDRLMATVNGQPVEHPVTIREIRRVQFTPVRLTEGYDVSEVDAFLDLAEQWLAG
ncbi:DivIVA domain-containing protein [Kribbella kalugense]|uniref:Cell wall synthesis protein Wag31 n=1 Tax=Kribbella kalugense TaxID=2512221 RepID=A0A4R7ZAH9_9ACTN|nr:DivIVA domain-containing protein [Kribbella kalugense]TDW14467.1 DivIVA domain-containing protein [Kribbella kalugense]